MKIKGRALLLAGSFGLIVSATAPGVHAFAATRPTTSMINTVAQNAQNQKMSATQTLILPYPPQSQTSMAYRARSGVASPLTTVEGAGGVARLSVLWSAKELAWNVTPYNMVTAWTFTGTITINVLDPYTHEYVYDDPIDVSGAGVPGGSAGENVSISGYTTGLSYTATLNGTATDALGDTDTVLPDCQVAFYQMRRKTPPFRAEISGADPGGVNPAFPVARCIA